MARLSPAYELPKRKTAAAMRPGETLPFLESALAQDKNGDLFVHGSLHPLDEETDAAVINSSPRCVLLRRDPDGFVLIVRPRNQGALHPAPLITDKSLPIVRIEEQGED
ncbi:MAG TPA: hypothetical protein VH351_15440 [Bryobacteraceae bacterium]|jgi:hypothetical protein|nr:hypothetical protein [Bryobacteraceae bacterium]